ncbi:MAG: IS1634 family transposase [Candidatus Methylomirabilales bacterium]
MYIEVVPNRSSPPCVLLREAWREGKKVKKRTLANLSSLPREQVELLRRVLKGEALVPAEEAFEILRARPHGHVAAVVGVLRKLGLPGLLSTRSHRKRQLALAMICARVMEPCSKLATARALDRETLASSLGEAVGVERAGADDLYEALDWLGRGQGRIEKKLARRHLAEGQLVLWDVSPVPFESHTCGLAAYGRPRGEKKSRLQLLFGLLTTPEGVPVAVEVFPGNTGDPSTVAPALDRLQARFGLKRVVVVGDRGMLTQARITEELLPRGVDWITSLRAPTIRKLVQEGPLQLSLFDRQDLAEIASPDFPGERLIACYNPLLANDRARKREELLQATEEKLEQVARATRRAQRPLWGQDKIGIRLGKVLGRSKVAKHFRYEITEQGFSFGRDKHSIAAEAALDGIYVLRTSLSREELDAEEVVRAYKRLSRLEQAFRISKDFALEVEPIYHRREDRVRAHVFLCMLAFYVRQHMEQALAPILFTDHDPQGAEARRESVVAPAVRSEAAVQKVRRKRTADGLPVHSFRSLLRDLATLTKNTVRMGETPVRFEQYARPTQLQERAFGLLEVSYRL